MQCTAAAASQNTGFGASPVGTGACPLYTARATTCPLTNPNGDVSGNEHSKILVVASCSMRCVVRLFSRN